MNPGDDTISRELQELAAASCDGDLTRQEAARLEELLAASPAARRYYLVYLHLHGELYWQQAVAAETPGPKVHATGGRGLRAPIPPVALPAPRQEPRMSRLRLFGFLVSAAVAAALLLYAWRSLPKRRPVLPAPAAPESDARLSGAVHARWGAASPAPASGRFLPADRSLELVHGVVEVTYPGGTRLLIRAPARFACEAGRRIRLDSGEMAVHAAATDAVEMALPDAAVQIGGASLGLRVWEGSTEMHVMEGEVSIDRGLPTGPEILAAGTASSWERGSAQPAWPTTYEPDRFLERLPERMPARSVARMRSLVAAHPRLIHQYTFEGTSRLEKCRDKRGSLHLTESVMIDGRGRGSLDYTAEGFDLTTEAVRPFRADEGGKSIGVALQSESPFYPPTEMTVELLLQYRPPADEDDELVGLAVATRDGEADCGFFVAVVGRGYLSLLLDADAEWPESAFQMVPDHWYYVAVTFAAGADTTVVNAYAADLTERERSLRHLLRAAIVPGVPAASRLGIGKGFDNSDAHAYPWPGALDEVAVYDAVLDQSALQAHLECLLPEDSARR